MQPSNTLEELYENHKGLVSDKWESYLTKYDAVFNPYKQKNINLLEIGVQNGGSLEIWAKYFRTARCIVGCDVNPACKNIDFSHDAIRFVPGDINDSKTLAAISRHASKFDIIIDDGSHVSSDIIHTFSTLFPLLAENGTYVIEDLHCSYWARFEGGLTTKISAISFLKKLVDIVNFEHWGMPGNRRDLLEQFNAQELSDDELALIHSVSFSNSVCIIQKKSKENNLLGKRWVVGEMEHVAPSKQANGTYSDPEPQRSQPLSDRSQIKGH